MKRPPTTSCPARPPPAAVNSDGSLSRITNWHRLSEEERAATTRRVAVRNARRLEELRAAGRHVTADGVPIALSQSGAAPPPADGDRGQS
jgi:hypothetical protein